MLWSHVLLDVTCDLKCLIIGFVDAYTQHVRSLTTPMAILVTTLPKNVTFLQPQQSCTFLSY